MDRKEPILEVDPPSQLSVDPTWIRWKATMNDNKSNTNKYTAQINIPDLQICRILAKWGVFPELVTFPWNILDMQISSLF